MAINFPSSPAIGDFYTDPNTGNRYLAAKGGNPAEWVSAANNSGGGGDYAFGAPGANVILSNPRWPHPFESMGFYLDAQAGNSVYLASNGYDDIEFLGPVAYKAESNQKGMVQYLSGFANVKNFSMILVGNAKDYGANITGPSAYPSMPNVLEKIDGYHVYGDECREFSVSVGNQSSLTSITNIYFEISRVLNNKTMSFSFNACALDQESVDGIIIAANDAVTRANIQVAGSGGGGSKVNVSGGTNAAPSAAAGPAILALTAIGFTVTTN